MRKNGSPWRRAGKAHIAAARTLQLPSRSRRTTFSDDHPIIIFDGLCALCSGWARFVLRHDRGRIFRLLPARSPIGRALYVHYRLDPDEFETDILLAEGIAWFKSEGSIHMAEGLGAPWSFARLLRVLPPRWRDALHMTLARNRLRWFGRRAVCYRAEPGQEQRFIA